MHHRLFRTWRNLVSLKISSSCLAFARTCKRISQADTDPGDIATATELSAVGNGAGSWGKVLEGLRSADGTTDKSLADIESDVAGKLKSKLAGTSPKIYVKRSSGVVTVFVGDASGNSVGGKLEVKSE